MTRISVSLEDPDATLAEALDRIEGEACVGDPRGAPPVDPPREVQELISLLRGQEEAPIVDLIAHAADGVLQFGTWSIAATEKHCVNMAAAIAPRLLTAIRLLGCYTAATPAGVSALQHVKRAFRTRVFGTSTMIAANDFASSGFASLSLLEEISEKSKITSGSIDERIAADLSRLPRALGIAGTNALHALLREESPRTARAMLSRYPGVWTLDLADTRPVALPTLHGLLATIEPVFWRAPGLLAIPDGEILYPVPGRSGRFHRVTSLFGGRVLRVYPRSHPSGVLVRYGGVRIF